MGAVTAREIHGDLLTVTTRMTLCALSLDFRRRRGPGECGGDAAATEIYQNIVLSLTVVCARKFMSKDTVASIGSAHSEALPEPASDTKYWYERH